MLDTRTLLACAVAAGTSVVALIILVRVSSSIGLVDRPNARKHHVGEIPLVGGLSVFIGLLAGSLLLRGLGPFGRTVLATAATLALLGALDDRYDLSVRA